MQNKHGNLAPFLEVLNKSETTVKNITRILAVALICLAPCSLLAADPNDSGSSTNPPISINNDAKVGDKPSEATQEIKKKEEEKQQAQAEEKTITPIKETNKEPEVKNPPPVASVEPTHSPASVPVEPVQKEVVQKMPENNSQLEHLSPRSDAKPSIRSRHHRERLAIQERIATPTTAAPSTEVVAPPSPSRPSRDNISVHKDAPQPVIRKESGSFGAEVRRITRENQDPTEQKQFRVREIRERDYQDRENNLRNREIFLQDREKRIRVSERDLQAREQYYRRLRAREWQDIASRDRELRYLMQREREQQRYYWEEDDLICHYVTRYRKVARVNKRVTVCEWRNGVYRCFHPTRYYIVPITRVVCE